MVKILSSLESTIWSPISGGIAAPKGFKASGICAGLKVSQKPDLGLILAPSGALCAGTFTQSILRAECVNLCDDRLKRTNGFVRAILINSGQANACTGDLGTQHFLIATEKISELLGIKKEEL